LSPFLIKLTTDASTAPVPDEDNATISFYKEFNHLEN